MKNTYYLKNLVFVAFILHFNINSNFMAQDTTMATLFEMSIEELINTKVTIASKSSQDISKAPSIVSVITAKEIEDMGAREIEDVLQTVPGFELVRGYGGYYGIGVRGVKDSRTTSKILIMIDGIPFNQIYYGNYIDWGYDINIDAVARIEIIRGPGSALYGRNAFSAVINIITKNGQTNDNIEVKSTIGTFNTRSLSGYFGYKKNKLSTSFSAKKTYTDVTDTKLDDGTDNVLKWNLNRNNLWLNTNISYGKFTISGVYLNLKGGALFSDTKVTNRIGNYSVSFQDKIGSKISINSRVYGHNSTYIEDIEQLKPGLHDSYPDGIYYTPSSKEYMYGLETDVNYKLSSNNDLLFGIQADLHGVYDVEITANIDMGTFAPIAGAGRNEQVLYEPGWFENNKHDYYNIAFFIQDIWYPHKNIGITMGGRYDVDSEIGGVINPRVGIVLHPINNGNIKLLYGRAYRAPAPSEQFRTLGFAVGNKNLNSEIINTLELALNWRNEQMSHAINVYRNKLNDMIYAAKITSVDPNNKYYNIGKNTSTGIEYENKLILSNNFYSYFNYSYVNTVNTDSINGKDTTYNHPDIAPHKINFGINYSFLKYYSINLNMFYRSEMVKFKIINTNTEVQNEIGNYGIFNSTFQVNNLIKNLKIYISVFNMLDKKYYSQDNEHLIQPTQPGRQFIGSIVYSFK